MLNLGEGRVAKEEGGGEGERGWNRGHHRSIDHMSHLGFRLTIFSRPPS